MSYTSSVLRDELQLENTPRLKTAGTLQDKLRRGQSNLFDMDDIAGVRLEPVADRLEQDRVVEAIVSRFPECRVKDRRINPNAGYRAVHVIVRVDIYRVEIQVRTRLQHSWAETNEKFADLVGRGLRYGEVPSDSIAAALHTVLLMAADALADHEATEAEFKRLEAEHETLLAALGDRRDSPVHNVPGITNALTAQDRAKATAQHLLDRLRDAVIGYEATRGLSEDR